MISRNHSGFQPLMPDYETAMSASFSRQQVMALFGAELTAVAPGRVEIGFAHRHDLTQQHGFIHAGVLTAVVDTACGYAAYSLMPPGASVLTVEFKVNFLAPAQGERFRAVGSVVKPGRTLTVCAGEVIAIRSGEEQLVATMSATMMTVLQRAEIPPG